MRVAPVKLAFFLCSGAVCGLAAVPVNAQSYNFLFTANGTSGVLALVLSGTNVTSASLTYGALSGALVTTPVQGGGVGEGSAPMFSILGSYPSTPYFVPGQANNINIQFTDTRASYA